MVVVRAVSSYRDLNGCISTLFVPHFSTVGVKIPRKKRIFPSKLIIMILDSHCLKSQRSLKERYSYLWHLIIEDFVPKRITSASCS